jgi:transposase
MDLVPREHSTGGKQKLLDISKRGNCYLRTLFVQGARAVLQFREKQSSGLSAWLADLTSRTHFFYRFAAFMLLVTFVALANDGGFLDGAIFLGRAALIVTA